MWLLVLVTAVLNIQDGQHMTVLEKYQTKVACIAEQARIAQEMEKAYPGDTQFTLACFYQPDKQASRDSGVRRS